MQLNASVDVRFVTTPDEVGLGRVVVNGRYFGLPVTVVTEYAALREAAAPRSEPVASGLPEWLARETYAVQHNPNCAKPYLVRLIGPGRMALDMKPYATVFGTDERSQDVLGFGVTLADAAEAARAARQAGMPKATEGA